MTGQSSFLIWGQFVSSMVSAEVLEHVAELCTPFAAQVSPAGYSIGLQ